MGIIFEVSDKSGRIIRLPTERWSHIRQEHPEIVNHEDLLAVLTKPDKITKSDRDEMVEWFYRYNKIKKRYMKVAVKYLNGDGYIITAHHTPKIE